MRLWGRKGKARRGGHTPTAPVTPGAMQTLGDGSAYGVYIASELEDVRALKASLEERALAVVTTSGVLVTLLFALASVVTSKKNYSIPVAARPALIVALAAFVLAAALALIVIVPSKHRGPSTADLEQIRLNT